MTSEPEMTGICWIVRTDPSRPVGSLKASLVLSLVGFNLGVEVGQLAIVSAFLPLAYRVRHSWPYQDMMLRLGSALIGLVACVRLVERSLGLSFS